MLLIISSLLEKSPTICPSFQIIVPALFKVVSLPIDFVLLLSRVKVDALSILIIPVPERVPAVQSFCPVKLTLPSVFNVPPVKSKVSILTVPIVFNVPLLIINLGKLSSFNSTSTVPPET